ncbi:hypothetical protein MRY87_04940 [bacterium]|nr:hypothetical protein [bacterium]
MFNPQQRNAAVATLAALSLVAPGCGGGGGSANVDQDRFSRDEVTARLGTITDPEVRLALEGHFNYVRITNDGIRTQLGGIGLLADNQRDHLAALEKLRNVYLAYHQAVADVPATDGSSIPFMGNFNPEFDRFIGMTVPLPEYLAGIWDRQNVAELLEANDVITGSFRTMSGDLGSGTGNNRPEDTSIAEATAVTNFFHEVEAYLWEQWLQQQ